MNNGIFTMAFIAIIILGLGIFAVIKNKRQMEIRKKHPGYPQGYWMGQGIAIGVAIGAGTGVALGNIAIGVGAGVALGAAIGKSLEKQHENEIRPATNEEKQINNQTRIIALGFLVLGVIVVAVLFLMQN